MDDRDVFFQRTEDRKSSANYKLAKHPEQDITDKATARRNHKSNHHFDRLMYDASICLGCTKKHCIGTCEYYKEESRKLREASGRSKKSRGKE